MAAPQTRTEFKEYCLRALGKPVINVNVADEQIEDRIDEALRYYADYHYDGAEQVYYKYEITGKEFPGAANTINIQTVGTGYSNTDTITISGGSGANASIVTTPTGAIQEVLITEPGRGYSNNSAITINTSTGTGANLSLITGDGSIPIPDNIIGVVKVYPLGNLNTSSMSMFDIRYQIALNDLYSLTSYSLVPYYMVMQHLSLIQELLVGQVPIRFNRHQNKAYLDMDWHGTYVGKYLLLEAYQVLDPDVYTDMWNDRWLQKYATALIKRQWGENLTKFSGFQLTGGIQFNGDRILNDAQSEIKDMEEDMIYSFSLPVTDMVG